MSLEEEKIVAALRDEKWDYRTAAGVAEETGIPIKTVRAFLESRKDIIWKSSIPDKRGRDLYTLNDRHSQSKEFLRNLSSFMSKIPS